MQEKRSRIHQLLGEQYRADLERGQSLAEVGIAFAAENDGVAGLCGGLGRGSDGFVHQYVMTDEYDKLVFAGDECFFKGLKAGGDLGTAPCFGGEFAIERGIGEQ